MSQPLHPVERALLRPFLTREAPGSFLSSDDVGPLTGLSPAQVQMGLEMVKSRGLIEERLDREETLLRPTDQGLQALAEGLPEEIIMEALATGPRPMSDLRGLFPDPSVASKAMGALKDAGSLKVVEGGQAVRAGDLPPGVLLLKKLLKMSAEAPVVLESLPKEEQELLSQYQRRRGKEKGLIRLDVRSFRSYRLSPEAGLTLSDLESGGKLLGNVTPEMLQTRSWEGGTFRPFSVGADAPPPPQGHLHPYREFLEEVRGHLVRLGFAEMTGSLVEPEFWNMDALFIPQTHPARNIHDIYLISEPRLAKNSHEWPMEAVARTHEGREAPVPTRGWRQGFDPEQAKRLLMRSQGTALSSRTLSRSPSVPGKYFAIARCFRHDQVDATHAVDFFQAEGIVLEEDASFVTLLGLLALLAREIAGVDQVHYKPAYFPFTEPSVELHAHHPELGWMELGGAGLFRPEVTRPLGVEVPVIAWGMGIDRMAMFRLGLSDIRDLFTGDLSVLSGMIRAEERSWAAAPHPSSPADPPR